MYVKPFVMDLPTFTFPCGTILGRKLWVARTSISVGVDEMQFISMLGHPNGIESFRALYYVARFDDPRSMAMILLTGGDQWLWKHDDGHDEVAESFLPDEIEARLHLDESFGYNAYEDIRETCCHSGSSSSTSAPKKQ